MRLLGGVLLDLDGAAEDPAGDAFDREPLVQAAEENPRRCFAFVVDVAAGFIAALERAGPGAGYILEGENRTARDLFAVFEAASGTPRPKWHTPFRVARFAGRLLRWRAEFRGVVPEFTGEVVGSDRPECAHASEREEGDLGYRVTPFREAIGATVGWLRETG